MSEKIKQAGKFTSKAFGLLIFSILFAFNIQVAFSDEAAGEIEFLGLKISLLNDVLGLPEQADNDGSRGGGGSVDMGTGYYAQVVGLTYDCGTFYWPMRCKCAKVFCMWDARSYCVPYDDCRN